MEEEDRKKLEGIMAELCAIFYKFVAKEYTPYLKIEDSEDAPCIVIGGGIMICYCYHPDYPERVYEVQVETIEYNYPHEPDWIDCDVVEVHTNKYAAIKKAVTLWLEINIDGYWENRAYEQMAKEYSEELIT